MRPSIYGELASWYWLLDPPADHEDEGTFFRDALIALRPEAKTLLELGAGAGNNALFMKQHFQSTLTDLSPEMLALSRSQNPECEHVLGDMRELRLGRQLDVVFVHDAVAYMRGPVRAPSLAGPAPQRGLQGDGPSSRARRRRPRPILRG